MLYSSPLVTRSILPAQVEVHVERDSSSRGVPVSSLMEDAKIDTRN